MYDDFIEQLRKTCWGESALDTDRERAFAADIIEELQYRLIIATNNADVWKESCYLAQKQLEESVMKLEQINAAYRFKSICDSNE